MQTQKIKFWYLFFASLILCNFLSISKSNELNNKTFNYQFLCKSKKIKCDININKNYLTINNNKIQKDEIKEIINKLICKNEFGLAKCLPSNMRNIEFQKIILIYGKKDLLNAEIIFIKDIIVANDFRKKLALWLEWN